MAEIAFHHQLFRVGMLPPFATEVSAWLAAEGFRSRGGRASSSDQPLLLVRGAGAQRGLVALHLLATPRSSSAVLPVAATCDLSNTFAASTRSASGRPRRLVHLWEDQWEEHRAIVRSRLLAMLGRSERIMARSTLARRIDSATCNAFLVDNHLWAATQARYRYGLYTRRGEELVAVASFSARWRVARHGERRASHELIRYCSRRGASVVGGISKLIAAFARDAAPDELVTVIDRDWSCGSGWAGLGFVPLTRMDPVRFYVGPDGLRCHPGAGPNPHRRRLPEPLQAELEAHGRRVDADGEARHTSEADDEAFLASRGYYPVSDAGAERWLLLITPYAEAVEPGDPEVEGNSR